MTTYDEHLQSGDPGDPPDDDARAAAAFREIHDAAVEAFGPDVTVEIHADGSCEDDAAPADWDTGESPRMAAAFAAFRPDEEAPDPEPPNLPAPFGDAGQLDLDTLRTLAPRVRTGLVESLRYSARLLRQGRGTVVVPEDTFDLVRRVTAAEEVLRQWSQAFAAAAAECVAIAEEEALTANGSYPGVEEAPSGSLFVPDGAGQRIAVRPDWKPGDAVFDVDTLAAWIAEQTVADEARKPDEEGASVWTNEEATSLVRDGIDRILALGKFTPGAKLLDALRKRLAEAGRDTDAGVIRQVRHAGDRRYVGVKVTREEA